MKKNNKNWTKVAIRYEEEWWGIYDYTTNEVISNGFEFKKLAVKDANENEWEVVEVDDKVIILEDDGEWGLYDLKRELIENGFDDKESATTYASELGFEIITTTPIEAKEGAKGDILTHFIQEIKKEFSDQNWEYLNFIADRVRNNQPKEGTKDNAEFKIGDKVLDLSDIEGVVIEGGNYPYLIRVSFGKNGSNWSDLNPSQLRRKPDNAEGLEGFTGGKWVAKGKQVYAGTFRLVSCNCYPPLPENVKEAEANAKLIADAPRLLKENKELKRYGLISIQDCLKLERKNRELKDFLSRIVGSMSLERSERFDLNNEAKELLK